MPKPNRIKVIKPRTNRQEQFAFHVFTPALMHRLQQPENGLKLPVMALRTSVDNFQSMLLFDQIEGTEFKLLPLFTNPLPGTGGRGVAILFSDKPLVCSFRGPTPKRIDCADSRLPADILADVLSLYDNSPFWADEQPISNLVLELAAT